MAKKAKLTAKKHDDERYNPWKVTLVILIIGALCWLILGLLPGCVVMTNMGKGEQKYNKPRHSQTSMDGTNDSHDIEIELRP